MQPENHLAEQRPHPITELQDQINRNISYFGALLKADQREQARFLAEVVQAVRSNPDLLNTDRDSLLFALGEAASMGLSVNPGLGEAWIIPRNCREGDNYIYRANFQPGYKGLIKLAYRSGLIDSIFCEVVYKGELFKRKGGTSPSIEHEPDEEARANRKSSDHAKDMVCAYAAVWLKGSQRPLFAVADASELREIAAAAGRGPWIKYFTAMSKKTALIRVCNLLPRTDDLRSLHNIVERDLTREGGSEPPRHERIEEPAPALQVAPPAEDELGRDLGEGLPQYVEPPHHDEAGAIPAAPQEQPTCTGEFGHIAYKNKLMADELAKLDGRETTSDNVWCWACKSAGIESEDDGYPVPGALHLDEGNAVAKVLDDEISRRRGAGS